MDDLNNLLEGFKDKFEQVEERIGELQDRRIKIIKSEEQKERRLKKCEQSLKGLSETIKWTNAWIMGVPEGETREKETVFEKTMAENFPNLKEDVNINIQEA